MRSRSGGAGVARTRRRARDSRSPLRSRPACPRATGTRTRPPGPRPPCPTGARTQPRRATRPSAHEQSTSKAHPNEPTNARSQASGHGKQLRCARRRKKLRRWRRRDGRAYGEERLELLGAQVPVVHVRADLHAGHSEIAHAPLQLLRRELAVLRAHEASVRCGPGQSRPVPSRLRLCAGPHPIGTGAALSSVQYWRG